MGSEPVTSAFMAAELPVATRTAAPSLRVCQESWNHPSGRAGLSIIALLMAATFVLAACGGDDGANGDAKQATALLNEGLQAQVQGETAQATEKFNEVIKIDPSNKFANYNLGLIEQDAGNDDDATSNYRLAIVVDKNFTPALYNLAILRNDAGDKQEALDLYTRATKADPKFARAFLNLGLLLNEMGDTAAADAALTTAVQLDPKLASRIPDDAKPSGS